MFYKVIHENAIVDALDKLTYVRFQLTHGKLLLCDKEYAEGILSSDENTVWYVDGMYGDNRNGYPVVTLEEISEEEYTSLKESLGYGQKIEEAEEIIEEPQESEQKEQAQVILTWKDKTELRLAYLESKIADILAQ